MKESPFSLLDLVRHQAWADAEHWRAIEALPAAYADEALRNRLHHVHLVQHAFLWTIKADGSSFAVTKPADFPSRAALRIYGEQATAGVVEFVQSASEEVLARPVRIVWFNDPPLTLSIAEAIVQATMHSQWHRGQNATRLRELGGEPPAVDFIFWIWKGRPAPEGTGRHGGTENA